MEVDIVAAVCVELIRLGQCTSRSDFSEEWLGREQSYYRSVQARGGIIGVHAQAHLAAKLENLGSYLQKSAVPSVAATGKALLDLHKAILEGLFKRVLWEAQYSQALRRYLR